MIFNATAHHFGLVYGRTGIGVHLRHTYSTYNIDLLKGSGFLINPGSYTHVCTCHMKFSLFIESQRLGGKADLVRGRISSSNSMIRNRESIKHRALDWIHKFGLLESAWGTFPPQFHMRPLQAPPNRVSCFACLFSSDSLIQQVQTTSTGGWAAQIEILARTNTVTIQYLLILTIASLAILHRHSLLTGAVIISVLNEVGVLPAKPDHLRAHKVWRIVSLSTPTRSC